MGRREGVSDDTFHNTHACREEQRQAGNWRADHPLMMSKTDLELCGVCMYMCVYAKVNSSNTVD